MDADPPRMARPTRRLRASSLFALTVLLGSALSVALPATLRAQAAPAAGEKKDKGKKDKDKKEEKDPKPEKEVPAFFRSESPLAVTLTTNIKQIRKDKGDDAPWRWASLTYDSAGKPAQMPVKVRTRGIWRLRNCSFPPLRLNFSDKASKHTPFDDLEHPKLVSYCKDTDGYEQYILQELQLYRVYQLLTPVSHRVRLLRMAYVDSASSKREAERYAILVEDPEQLANRNLARIVKIKGASVADLEAPQLALAYLFEYLIGNLDFSFNGLHNTELLATMDGRILPVAYDFDFAGAVNTSYATPPQNYGVPNVRTRKFMASCELRAEFPTALALLQSKREAIYALYHDEIGKLMDQRVVNETLHYFDDFFNDVRTPADAKRNVFDRCIRPG
jgi:hypothetical protein